MSFFINHLVSRASCIKIRNAPSDMSNLAFVALKMVLRVYGCGSACIAEIEAFKRSMGFVVSDLSTAAQEDVAEENGVASLLPTGTSSHRGSWISSCSVASFASGGLTFSAFSNSSPAGVSLGRLSGTYHSAR